MEDRNLGPCGALPPLLGTSPRRDIHSRAKSGRAARLTHSAFTLLLASFVVAGCARGGSGAAENGGSESIGGNQNRAGEGASGGDVGTASSGGSSNGGGVSTNTGGAAGTTGAGGDASGGARASGGSAGITGGSSGGGSGITGGSGGKGSAGSGEVAGGSGGKGGASSAGAAAGGLAGSGGVGTAVTVDGPRVLVGGRAFHIRGVCWNPVPKGKTHPAGLDFAGFADRDIPLMQQAGINVVRTYEPLTNLSVLDKLQAAGIYVLDSVYPYGGDAPSVVTARVAPIKNHPAILMWLIGNEWNYNGLYVDLPQAEAMTRLNEVAALLKAADPTHPIATVYGELPGAQVISAMPNVDVWGINAYRGLGFGDLFSLWRARSDKPMFLAEYGADAYNATAKKYDPESQAMAVTALTQELADNSAAFQADGITLGGAVFEWADEWWKDGAGSPDQQEVGGVAPGGGPYPDQTFNEEWWGLVDIERKPRAAYDALKAVLATLPK